jgi:hypothetical protein
MDFLLKNLSPKLLLGLLPMILVKTGNYFKNKDANETGADDAFGNVLIALAPAVEALDDGNENAFKKALRVVNQTLSNYLNNSK